MKRVLFLFLVVVVMSSCAELKQSGKSIGHATRDAAKTIGHGARDAAKAVGKGVKRVAKGDEKKDNKKK